MELHVKPTYAVLLPQRSAGASVRTEAQRENEKNLADNEHQGKLSAKAVRRLSNSVNWLVASAKQKYVFDKATNKRYSFRVNFVTLTLPTLDHSITDHTFKKVLLHGFINACRYKFDLKNFVWKVEAQENGNIHVHFTTDTFMHWKEVRNIWNRILSKHGLIDTYHKKHSSMNFDTYCKIYNADKSRSIKDMAKSFKYGQDTNWRDPNTTDVHAVHKVKDIAAYLAKYMGKKEEDRRPIQGRLWGCSYNLSAENKLTLELHSYHDQDIIEPLLNQKIKYKPIEAFSKLSNVPTKIGEMFFFKLSDWGTIIKGRLLAAYNEHRFNIRYNIDVRAIKASIKERLPKPIPSLAFSTPNDIKSHYLNSNL